MLNQLGKHRRLITGACSYLQHFFRIIHQQLFCHARNNIGLGDSLPVSYRERSVNVCR